MLLEGFLSFIANKFNTSESLRDSWREHRAGSTFRWEWKSDDNAIEAAIVFKNGKVAVLKKIPGDMETIIIFKESDDLLKWPTRLPMNYIKWCCLVQWEQRQHHAGQLFNYLMSLVFEKYQQIGVDRQIEVHKKANKAVGKDVQDIETCRQEKPKRKISRVSGKRLTLVSSILKIPISPGTVWKIFRVLNNFRAEYFR